MKKINIENKINKYYVIIGSIVILAVAVLLVISVKEHNEQYLVQKGRLEYTEVTTAYIIKDEHTIKKDKSKVLVPVISEGARASKDSIIATYKGQEYINYEENLAKMDKEILERMKDLPQVYSSEITAIDETIYMLVKESIGQTSYNKMQEYKKRINSNINKRATIIGELSPDGAEIKELIEQRNKYEAEAKQSTDNILSPTTGIVSYSTDGLEEKLNAYNIDKLSYDSIKSIVDTASQSDNTKIKVVNNYEAYIVLKTDLKNEDYLKEGYDYKIRLIEQDNYELLGNLEKIQIIETGIEAYLKITNGIENIVNLREAEIEIVWDYADGFIIPNDALYKYDNIDAHYVSAIKYGEYENIPVSIKLKKDNYLVVDNYDDEKLEELGIEAEYNLKLYDRIIKKTKR